MVSEMSQWESLREREPMVSQALDLAKELSSHSLLLRYKQDFFTVPLSSLHWLSVTQHQKNSDFMGKKPYGL